MRLAGIGLLLVGGLVGLGSIGAEDITTAQFALTLGGFLFVAGAVFAASAGIQDAIKRRP